jgi:uncharacterized membrane protein
MEALAVLVVLAIAACVFILPIVAIVLASRAESKTRALEETAARLQNDLTALAARVQRLRATGGATDSVPPETQTSRTPVPAARPAGAATGSPPATPTPPLPQPSPPLPPSASALPPRTEPAEHRPPASTAPAAGVPAGLPPRPAPRPPSRPPAVPPAGTARPPQPPERGGFDWESLVGVRLFSAVAGIALVLAAVFFLRYSIDRGWLQPPVRVVIGILTGVSLLVVCERKAARRYPVTANALDAAAVSILFATFFAAHALWKLVPALPTFLLLALVAAVAVLLSIRHDSLFIAVLGLLGGFSTPALLSTGENRPIPLFGYLLVLNVGLGWVARARGWPLLTGLSLVLTALYQWGWVVKFLDAAQVPLGAAIFLVLPAASFAVLALARRRARATSADRPLEETAVLGSAMPLLFTLYLAAVPAYGARFVVLFGFLFIVDVALLVIALARRAFLIHLAGAVATVLTFMIWLARSYASEAWPEVLGAVAVFTCLYLLAEPLASWMRVEADASLKAASFAAPLLLATAPVVVVLEPACARPLVLFGAAFVLLALVAAAAIHRRQGALYFVAAFLVLVAEAVWSARYLTSEHLPAALALYVIFGLAYLAIPVLARSLDRPLLPTWGPGLVLIAALLLLFHLSRQPIAPGALFGLALLLAVLNGGVFVEAASARLSGLSVAGGFLSWLVLGAWWLEAARTVPLLPALAVVTGLSLLMVAGHVWAHARAGGTEAEGFSLGCVLGLVGHLFLMAVAGDPALGVPPWPLFGVLAVLTLAFTAAALRLRQGLFQVAGVGAGALALLVWTAHAPSPSWASVALAALAVFAGLALASIRLAELTGDRGQAWSAAAVVAFFALHAGAILASGRMAPPTALLCAAHVVALAAVLALATSRWPSVGLFAVATSAGAVVAFAGLHPGTAEWSSRLAVAGAIYLVFLAWPFAAGRAAVRVREPWLGAILASAPFFFVARQALVAGGYGGVIGTLPLAQAVAMALLLRRLLAIEPGHHRDRGRLALVSGAALAFVTVAIPLQLDRQWITIGWALEGAALAWLYRRIGHRGLLWSSAGLLGAAFVRLALNPEVFRYAARSAVPVLNWYLYTYLLCAAALIAAGLLLRREEDRLLPGLPRTSTGAFAGAGVLLFLLLNIEIADFYAEGPTFALRFGVRLEQDLTYTIGWLVFGVGLLAVGIATRSRGARLAALALVAVTACKGFLYDLSRLGGLYLVASFVGLAVALALVALALQRFVLRSRETA